jgi:cysteinyl-tRNA synthetase
LFLLFSPLNIFPAASVLPAIFYLHNFVAMDLNNQLYIYNSYSRKKEAFESLVPNHAGMYVCGPTVSGESHLGHARPYITFDVLYRYLTYLGYKVRYVRNITDAGHFEEEGREAEDKISKKAVLEKLEPMELVTKYTNLFHWAMKQFNNMEPSIEPTATGHIVEQIEMIKKIMARGYAYEVNGSVYFEVLKYANDYKNSNPYGQLSGRVLDEMLETTRELEGQEEKRNKADFALWKKAPPAHIMRWASPWGDGFPGWHIECSAMSSKYLGQQFDIHGGGMDLQFPHHESEIAQSCVCHEGKMMARYWIHNNMITINGKKMGKSYNNVIKLTELFSGNHPLLQQPYHPMAIRFFILQSHYRSTLDFSNEALQASEKAFKRLWEAYEVLKKIDASTQPDLGTDADLELSINKYLDLLAPSMNDDLNTAKVLANLFELAPVINGLKAGQIEPDRLGSATIHRMKKSFSRWLEDILGLQAPELQDAGKHLQSVMDVLLALRKEARERKDFKTSDKIRDGLSEAGIVLKDEKDGSVTWTI